MLGVGDRVQGVLDEADGANIGGVGDRRVNDKGNLAVALGAVEVIGPFLGGSWCKGT
jgi:hypothetical protein